MQQADGRGGEAGVVAQRHRQQVDVTVLRAERITRSPRGCDCRRPPRSAWACRCCHRRSSTSTPVKPPRAAGRRTARHRARNPLARSASRRADRRGRRSARAACRSRMPVELGVGQPRRQRLRNRAELPARERPPGSTRSSSASRSTRSHLVRHRVRRTRGQPVGRCVEFGAGQRASLAGDRGCVGVGARPARRPACRSAERRSTTSVPALRREDRARVVHQHRGELLVGDAALPQRGDARRRGCAGSASWAARPGRVASGSASK